MIKTVSLLGFLTLAGCSVVSKGKEVSGGGDTGGGEAPAASGFADNMHDAPAFSQGDSLTANLECHASGYLKVDAGAGAPLQLSVNIEGPEGACFDLSWLNSNGGSQNGGQMFGEVCESKTFDVTGLEGGAYIQISESGVCKGASVTLAMQ